LEEEGGVGGKRGRICASYYLPLLQRPNNYNQGGDQDLQAKHNERKSDFCLSRKRAEASKIYKQETILANDEYRDVLRLEGDKRGIVVIFRGEALT